MVRLIAVCLWGGLDSRKQLKFGCSELLRKGASPNHRRAQRELARASHRVVVGQVRGILVGHVLEQPRRGHQHSGHEGVPLLRPRCQVGPALRHLRTQAWRAHVITMSVITKLSVH